MKTSALLAIMLVAAAPAFAQSPEPAPKTPAAAAPAKPSAAKHADADNSEARVERRIAQMHQRLKITSEQEPAWDAFAQVMRDNVTTTEQAYEQRRATIATMSAPDNMRNFAEIEQARTQGVAKLAASFQTLYDGMSDEQKKLADDMFRHFEERPASHKKPK